MTRTGLQLITDALKLIGVVAGHEVPTSAEQTDAFARLNELIDSWGLSPNTMFASHREVASLIATQQTYTVGDGGDIDVAVPPVTIEAATYLVTGTPTTEVFLDLGMDQAVIAVAQKSLTGSPPQILSYTKGAPFGELWVWPIPVATQQIALYWKEAIVQFPDLVTEVYLSPGYARALRTNLAMELCSEFGRVLDPVVERAARDSLADVKRANFPMVEVGIDPALTQGSSGYDIFSDG